MLAFFIFFSTRLETRILASYKSTIGIATIIWEITSGGVMAAEIISTPTIACFLNFIKKAGVITPRRVNKYATTGKRKSKPV